MGVTVTPFTLFQEAGVETKNRSLKYDLNAMADFEQVTGMGLAQLMSTNAVFAATRALLWAGLRHKDRGLTLDVTGQLMQQYVMSAEDRSVMQILEACLNAASDQKAIPNLKRTQDQDGEDDGPNGPASSPTTGTTTVRGSVTSAPLSSTPMTDSDSSQTN